MSDRNLEREAEAARVLLENLRDVIGNDLELRVDTLDGETRLFEIIDQTIEADAEFDAMIEIIDRRMVDLRDRKERFKSRKAAARAAIAAALETVEIKSLVRPCGTVSISKPRKALEIVDETEISSEFWKRADPKLDRTALTKALKDGEVPGAALVDGASTIAIRRG